MKEYRVVFKYRPGTDKIPPEYVFVETEDEDGKGIGKGKWIEMEAPLIALALPTYEEKYRIVSRTLSNILNSINWSLNFGVFTGSVFKRIIKEAKDDLSELSEDFIKT